MICLQWVLRLSVHAMAVKTGPDNVWSMSMRWNSSRVDSNQWQWTHQGEADHFTVRPIKYQCWYCCHPIAIEPLPLRQDCLQQWQIVRTHTIIITCMNPVWPNTAIYISALHEIYARQIYHRPFVMLLRTWRRVTMVIMHALPYNLPSWLCVAKVPKNCSPLVIKISFKSMDYTDDFKFRVSMASPGFSSFTYRWVPWLSLAMTSAEKKTYTSIILHSCHLASIVYPQTAKNRNYHNIILFPFFEILDFWILTNLFHFR